MIIEMGELTIRGTGPAILKDVFNGAEFVTSEGNKIAVSMRDDSFEISVTPLGQKTTWHVVSLENSDIRPMAEEVGRHGIGSGSIPQ